MRKSMVALASTIAVLALPAMASASTTLDPSSGTGFVGKGDVQSVFALNNAALQKDAGNMVFTYTDSQSADYSYDCTWSTGTNHVTVHTITNTTSTVSDIVTTVNGKPRTNPNQSVTGFNLTGLGLSTTTTSGSVPVDGAPCLAVDNQGNGVIGAIGNISGPTNVSDDQTLAVSDSIDGLSPASTALDGANVWHLTNGLNPVTGSTNYGTSNGSVY